MPHKDGGKRKLLIKTMPIAGSYWTVAGDRHVRCDREHKDPITSARVAEPMMDEEQISDISLAVLPGPRRLAMGWSHIKFRPQLPSVALASRSIAFARMGLGYFS